MIPRRGLSLLLFASVAVLAACAGDDGPPRGGPGGHHDEAPEMLFISPMGEPFRAKPPAPYPVEAWFKGADANGDGKLDLAEFEADAVRFFHVLDITKDGVIDHREVYYYEHITVPEMLGQQFGALRRATAPNYFQLAQYGGGGGGGMGGGGGGGMGGGGGAPPPMSGGDSSSSPRMTDQPLVGAAAFGLLADPEPVQGSDIRLTGNITLSDFKTRADQRFELLDRTHRGYLTLAELPETQVQQNMPHHRGRRGPPRGV